MTVVPARKKIVLVCMVNSIHVARWVAQFPSDQYEFILVPSTPSFYEHPRLTKLAKENKNISFYPFQGRLGQYVWLADQFISDSIRSWFLQRLLKRVKPDYVHALEFQHGAYLVEKTLRRYKLETPFIATCYGSDIYWFQRFPKHLKRIQAVLKRADFYSAECHRDVLLAEANGFKGTCLPTIPNAGGITEDYLQMQVQKPADRKLVMVKGYDSWVGRGSIAAEALGLISNQLDGLELVFYSCERKTRKAIAALPADLRARVQIHKKGKLAHEEVMKLFSQSLIYVGVSLSDGISTSLTEAMAMGAFPVQTNTACTSEWFSAPEQGIEVRDIKVQQVAQDISEALVRARSLPLDSWERRRLEVLQLLDQDTITSQALTFYR